jgi:hypothetical protein
VFKNPRLSLLHLFYPPYTNMHRRAMEFLIRTSAERGARALAALRDRPPRGRVVPSMRRNTR